MSIAPRLLVHAEHMRAMLALARKCPTEVGGYGLVSQLSRACFLLEEVYVLDQVATPVSTVTNANEVIDDAVRLLETDELKLRRFRWHSHCSFPVYFSPTDVADIMQHDEPLLFSFVLNRRGDFEARCDTFSKGVRRQWHLDITFLFDTEDLAEWAEEEIRRHVRTTSKVKGAVHDLIRRLPGRRDVL